MTRVIKSVSFNMEDPIERELFEIANKDGMFSKNVKRMMASYFLPIRPVLSSTKVEKKEEIDVDSFAFGEDE